MGLSEPWGSLVEACVPPVRSPSLPGICGAGVAGFPSISGPLIVPLGEALVFRSADDWKMLEEGNPTHSARCVVLRLRS
jgi:hypothetical protein